MPGTNNETDGLSKTYKRVRGKITGENVYRDSLIVLERMWKLRLQLRVGWWDAMFIIVNIQ